ncbi:bacteriocin immunity protein [Serratia fonticola]|uniref:bacteriocin immunity protein n=1 Tax=Serratia fonticola TaxID=47917 RepID=UPI0015C6443D|nr:bacteriocin immunity protein [Serratia fonticola]NXZ90119.1 bacteriocin immunity protein [Serratia fonticola]NYA46055.1 bacteriocin immunity protein [Serratia fonticola]
MEKQKISEYTEKEFLDFVTGICKANYPTEEAQTAAVVLFNKLTEHPGLSDLIYYPDNGNDGSPASIVKTVKEWRAKNGKPGFKTA